MRSDRGRHRRRRRHGHLPSVVGSVAVAAAASGALTANASAADSEPGTQVLAAPSRPGLEAAAAEPASTDTAFEAVATAQRSLTLNSTDSAAQAHDAIVAAERTNALYRAARADRVALREANRWVAPTTNYRITATFGAGGSMWANRHTGLDLAAPTGTPVMSTARGEIVEAGWDGSYGQKVVVRHEDGTETWYCHLSRILLTSGTVEAGQQIGAVGSTGNSSGPHLHLEVHPAGGQPVNPHAYLTEQGVKL